MSVQRRACKEKSHVCMGGGSQIMGICQLSHKNERNINLETCEQLFVTV